MSDVNTLHERLRRLVQGADAVSDPREIWLQASEIGAVDAIRAEVSEIQITRRVIFRNDREMEIAFKVASGRVLNLSEPVSTCLLQGSETLAMLRDIPTAESKCARIARMVAAFAAGATRLTAETQRLNDGATSLDAGLPMTAIFPTGSKQDSDRFNAAKPDVLRDFLQKSRAFSSAGSCLFDGEVEMEHGPDAILQGLRNLLQIETAEAVASAPAQIDPGDLCQCVIYSGHPSEGQTVLCVSHANGVAAMKMGTDALAEAIAMWKSFAKW